MKKLLGLSALAIIGLSVSGCETMHGLGKDIEKAGDAIQDVAK